jgi:hypothetical protein
MVFVVFLDFGAVPTVLYLLFFWILELFRQSGICCFSGFWSCSDSLVFVVFLDFGAVPTVWYLLFFWILELFRQSGICCFSRFWRCSDSLVFVVFHFISIPELYI